MPFEYEIISSTLSVGSERNWIFCRDGQALRLAFKWKG